MKLSLILYESLISDCFSFLSILDFGSPLEESLIVLIHCSHMILIECIHSRVHIFDSVGFLMVEMLCREYIQSSGTKLAVESSQILCRFTVLFHQECEFFDTLFHLKELLEVSIDLRIVKAIQF